MKDREYIENLIARSLNGTVSSDEFQELKTWIDESPENKKEYIVLKDIWDIARHPKSNAEDQLTLFYKNQLEKTKKSRLLWIRYSSVVAAILAIGLVISLLIPQEKSVESITC